MKLDQAVANWIKASYLFWHGPYAHSNDATENMIQAEDDLREALTGSRGLDMAAQHTTVGIDFEALERLYRDRKAKGDSIGYPGCSDPYPTPPVNPRFARLPEDGTTTRTKKKKKVSKKKLIKRTKTTKVKLRRR